jgi:hypothetical protein
MQKIKNLNVEWTHKDKIYNNHIILRKIKIEKYILEKFQCTSLINSSFDATSFFILILTLL